MLHKSDGYTVFCDDIRHEVGNKVSLLGVYGTEMFVFQPFPMVIYRMGFHVIYREDINAPLRDLTFCIFLPGDMDDNPTYKAEISRSEWQIPPLPLDVDTSTRRVSAFNVILNPVPLKQEGKIKVRVIVGGEEIKLGTLSVKYREPPSES
jgi:hypothetical protein